ncbi:hypothetical protein C7434_0509 [Pantoea sp. PNA 14-12]|nr:hypothetical protein C7434_0509 [Pantoea sp. PNA 14-12]
MPVTLPVPGTGFPAARVISVFSLQRQIFSMLSIVKEVDYFVTVMFYSALSP